MYKCTEKKKLSKAAEDDASNLSASVAAMHIVESAMTFHRKIIIMHRDIVTSNVYRLAGRKSIFQQLFQNARKAGKAEQLIVCGCFKV